MGRPGFLRTLLFLATGLALPLFAFPPVHVLGKALDVATILAAVFLVSSLPAVLRWRRAAGRAAVAPFAVGAFVVPLLALIPTRPAYFSIKAFAFSYCHWLFVVSFFLAAVTLSPSDAWRRRLVVWNVGAAVLVAVFGLYQAIGIPRHWPATGARLLPMQRQDFGFMALGNYVRPTSVFLEPSFLGGYLAWNLVLALAVWLWAGTRRDRLTWGGAAAVLGLTIAATISLGTYADLLALTAAFVLTAVRSGRLSKRAIARALAVLGVLLLAAALSPLGRPIGNAIAQRYRNVLAIPEALRQANPDLQESAWLRARNVALTVEMLRTRPLTGIGLGQFVRYLPPERRNPLMVEESWCGWLAVAAEMGILGPFLLAAAFVAAWPRGRGRPIQDEWSLAALVLLAVVAVQQLHTASFIDLWWWYPASLAAALARKAQAADSAILSSS